MHMARGRNTAAITGCIWNGVTVWQVVKDILFELVDSTAKRVMEPDLDFTPLHP
jgi:hypothetical protein